MERDACIASTFIAVHNKMCAPHSVPAVYPGLQIGITIFTKSFFKLPGNGNKISHA